MNEKLLKQFESISNPKILVVGDLILDRYCIGDANRVSPEAPVLVLQADEPEVRLGGAASVAMLLKALGAEVDLATVMGQDAAGHTAARLLDETGIGHEMVLCHANRPTTVKERFVGRAAGRHPHQILRVDHETRRPIDDDMQQYLFDVISMRLADYQAVLISDYVKGVCTRPLLKVLIAAAKRECLPVIVDPGRTSDFSRYRNATLITPNRIEAAEAAEQTIAEPVDALAAGRWLCRQYNFGATLVTLDSQGMALVDDLGTEQIFATRSREVYDVTGAGDTVLALAGLCLAEDLSLETTARLANLAAGLQVERLGVAPITRDEIRAELADGRRTVKSIVTLDEMAVLAGSYRQQGRKIVFTNGCFDLLHVGHVQYLQQAAALGDVLVVAVNDDSGAGRLKGPSRPVIPQNDRAALLAALNCVDHVLIMSDSTPHKLLRRLRPDVLAKGGTYTRDEVVGREVVEDYGGHVCVVSQVEGVSTTQILTNLNDCGPAPGT